MHDEHEATGREGGVELFEDSRSGVDEFLDALRTYDEAPISSWLERLAARGYTAPAPDSLADEQIAGEIQTLAGELAAMHAFLHYTDHLDDRALYEMLVTDILAVGTRDIGVHPDVQCHIDVLGDDEEDIKIWLKHYAGEDDRAFWLRDFPEDEMPEHEPPPFDRDRRLPRPLS